MQFDFQALAYGPGIVVICLVALAFDALSGNIPVLRRLIPHPALVMAALIGGLAARLNRPERGPAARLVRGLLVQLVITTLALLVALGFDYLTDTIPFFWILTLLLVMSLMVQRGPFDEVGRVTLGYAEGGLSSARDAAASVIGPPASQMSEARLNRALAAHLAGRFADGLVAGVFWLLVLGLPGLVLWRTINIAGRLLDDARPDMSTFGLIATRLNEAVGLLPAWLAGLALSIAAIFVPGANPLNAFAAMFGGGGSVGKGEPPRRHSERAPVAAAMAALTGPDPDKQMTGPDVVRAQYLYAIACLLVFAFAALQLMLRYAI